jgi:hypothetical protein
MRPDDSGANGFPLPALRGSVSIGRSTPTPPAHDAARLLTLRRDELDALFARAEAGPMPDGEYRGTLILPLGAAPLRGAAALVGSLAWRGKVFDAATQRVTNRVLPFALRAVAAEVRREPSRLDGRACLVLDYARTSLVARGVRDELRLLRPGLYLGRAYLHGVRIADFALEAS